MPQLVYSIYDGMFFVVPLVIYLCLERGWKNLCMV